MRAEQALFGTWGVFFEEADPLFRFCDAGMHWTCYADWPERPRFARTCFEVWVRSPNPYWGTVLVTEDMLLTVNPDPAVASLWLVLAATGTRRSIKLRDWPCFLADATSEEAPHEVERRALEAVMPRLRALGADPDALVARAVFPEPPPPDSGQLRRKETLRRLRRWNREARRTAEVAARDGVKCPSCGAHRLDHRFVDQSSRRAPSFFICAGCARSFSHEDLSHLC